MKRKLHIISFDGLSKLDMDFLVRQKNFSRLLDEASYSFDVKSIYPTLTYPAHTSIVTGNYPNKHGIINNTKLEPERDNPDWFWYEKYIKTKTFQQLASENGYSILSVFWPVTAGSKAIKYHVPEIYPNRKWDRQLFVSLRTGSFLYQLDLFKRFGHLVNGFSQPELDSFTHNSYIYSLKNYKTDITMVHYTDLDTIRHEFGFYSQEAKEALLRHDKRLGDILDTIESLEAMKNTTIVVLGDHSSIDAHHIIFLNSLFEKEGLLTTRNGKIADYQLLAKDAGGSCYVYSKGDKSFEEVRKLIEDKIDPAAIEKIYSSEEVKAQGADENCLMMLEASRGYLFENGLASEPVMKIEDLKGSDIVYHNNNHGYSPTTKKDYETVFIIKGSGIKAGIDIGDICLIDEGPTFAKLLGLELKNTDGRILEEILLGE